MNNLFIKHVKETELPTWLLARGITSLTTDEISAIINMPKNQVPQRLALLNKLLLFTCGLWAPIPPEYMTWGAPPAIVFIDSMMRYMGMGLLHRLAVICRTARLFTPCSVDFSGCRYPCDQNEIHWTFQINILSKGSYPPH